MNLNDELIKTNGNVMYIITANDLQEVINYTVTTTRKELEQIIIDEKSEVYLSPKEVSKMLDVDPSTLWRWGKRGYLVPLEIGGKRKYRKSDINVKCFDSVNLLNQ